MMTAKQKGQKAEKIVQRSLWQRNFRVKDVSMLKHPDGFFDLLVNEKYRVEVKSIHGKDRGVISSLRPAAFDVLCVVLCGEVRNSIFYLKDKSYLDFLIRGGGISITPKTLTEYFTIKPQEVMPTSI